MFFFFAKGFQIFGKRLGFEIFSWENLTKKKEKKKKEFIVFGVVCMFCLADTMY